MSLEIDLHAGHRERLRQRFQSERNSISEKEFLELLLSYAIPRKDTSQLAEDLINRFASLSNILSAHPDALYLVPGIGEKTVTFLKIINSVNTRNDSEMTYQHDLFGLPPKTVIKAKGIRVFTDDEVATSLQFLPMAGNYTNYASYKSFLENQLPYNSKATRQRRTNYILNRFYPDGKLNTPLSFFTQANNSKEALKSVVFYHLVKVEPLLTRISNDLIYPALPLGRIEREQVKEFILRLLPNIKETSQKKIMPSIFKVYDLLEKSHSSDTQLTFQLHIGNLDAFFYILSSEYPEPGIYSFESLFDGPAHKWLLWDKEWIRKQLYLLRDMHIVSKVSEIDSAKQFSLEYGQMECLELYFAASGKNSYYQRNGGN